MQMTNPNGLAHALAPTHTPRPCDYGPFGQGIKASLTVTLSEPERASMAEYYLQTYRAAIRGKRSLDRECESLSRKFLDAQQEQADCVTRIEQATAMLMKLGRALPQIEPEPVAI